MIRPTGLMDEEPEASSRETVSAEDDAILADFLARHGIVEEQDSREEVPSAEAELAKPQPTQNRRTKRSRGLRNDWKRLD